MGARRCFMGVLALTAVAAALHYWLAVPTGLVRSVYPAADFNATPLQQELTTDVSLAFLDDAPELPRRFFSVRWRGVWFFPRQQTIELKVTGDDRVDLRLNGATLVRHPEGDGILSTWTLTIAPGSHDLVIDYEQHDGAAGLNVQWAPAGQALRPLSAYVLFPERVAAREYWIGIGLRWLRWGVTLLWLTAIVAYARLWGARLAVKGAPAARRLVRWWRARRPLVTARDRILEWRKANAPRTTRELRQRVALVVFPALLGPVVLFLVGPHTVYNGNQGEFNTSFPAIAFPRLIAAVGISWMLLMAAGCVTAMLSRRLTRIYAALLFGAGVLVWAQGNLLVGDYGLLTGEELDLGAQAWRAPYEILLWGGVLGAAAVFARSVSNVAPLASALLVVSQMILLAASTIVSAGESEDTRDRRAWRVPPEKIYQLSRNRNVIHVVLDAFLSETFAQLLEKDRETFDRDLSGFVFFADHLGAFPTTRASMPAMLSGLAYRNERPFVEFQRMAIEERGIFPALARNGYQIHSVTFHHREQPPPSLPGGEVVRYTIPTPYESYEGYVGFAAAQLIDVSLFRHVPHTLKAHVYNADLWLLQNRYTAREAARRARPSNHAAFLDEFTRRLTVAEDRPVFTYIHVAIPHPPLVMTADCSFLGQQDRSRTAYAAQARCGVALIQRLFDRLRELDAYDRSVIVLTSDHGWRAPGPPHPLRDVRSPAGRLDSVAPAAMPLLAIKPSGSSGPLRISYAPTTITDIPATIVDLLGLPNDFPGESAFRIDERAARPRTFAHHPWGDAGWKQPYFDVLRVFSVEGRVLDPNAWRFQKAIFEPSDELEAQLEEHEYGLSQVGQGPDGPFRWGDPYVVTYAPADARALFVEVRKAPGSPRQTLTVRIDGHEAARHLLADDSWQAVRVELPGRERAANVYSVELLVDPAWRERDGRVRGAMYRALTWSR